jgi:hypothetical protein
LKTLNRILLLSVLTAASFAGPATAALVPVDGTFGIGTVHPMDTSHVVAARPDGTYLVVANNGGLFGRFVGPGGALIGEEIEIESGAVTGSPAVAFRQDGGFIVVYTRQREILAAVYDRNGDHLRYVIAGPQRHSGRRNLQPSVAVAADGSWMAAWRETDATSFPHEGVLYGRWFAPDSTPKTEATLLDENAFLPYGPQVTAAPDGGFFVVWSQTSGELITPVHVNKLHGRRFDGNGAPLHQTMYLSYGSRGHLFPRPQGDGYVLVASGPSFRPWLLRLDLNGEHAGPEVDSAFSSPGESAEATVDAEGRLLVTALGFDGVIYGRLFDLSTLLPLSKPFPIPTPSGGPQLFKSPASAWPGQFLALWYGVDFVATPIPGPLEGQIFTLDCGADDQKTLCLRDGRFRAEVSWRDHQGNTGAGQPVALGDDTGTFWFFSSSNAELFVKILDGRGVNGRFWVFYGSLSDVEYTIRIEDMVTGQVRTYQNPSGNMASHADVEAFPDAASAAAPRLSRSVRSAAQPLIEPILCAYGADALCLLGMEYQVTVGFVDPLTGQTRTARGFAFSQESGAFWFFDQGNIELFVKVLDGSAVNGHAWVFHAALTDVDYTITVKHVPTLASWQYHNPRGRMHSGADTSALPPPTGD